VGADTHRIAETGEADEVPKTITPWTKAITVVLILLQVTVTYGLGYVAYFLLQASGLGVSLNLPSAARLLGLGLIAIGALTGLATLRYRHPRDMLASTSVTLFKLVRRERSVAGRTEPFIPAGPYRYVRNPLYFGVVAFAFGFGAALSSVTLLLWGAVLVAWFWLFLIRFEERELADLFGEHYLEYKRQVPMLFPYGRKYNVTTQQPAHQGKRD
jgi:protein-S-isoprenylcysteine O-methyltransferase Ste14